MQQVTKLAKVTATGHNLFNLVRSMASSSFKERIPQATQDNIKETASAIFSSERTFNEFSDILINRIGKVTIEYMMFTNPLAVLKKGRLEYGDTIEAIYIELPEAHDFETEAVYSGEVFAREIPKTLTAFYRRNYRVFYKTSMSEDQWRAAFTSWGELDRFVAALFQTLYTAAQYDEFLAMLNIINEAGENGDIKSVTVAPVTDKESAENLLVSIKAHANKFVFPSAEYNTSGVLSNTPDKSNLVLFVDADADAFIDVKALAAAFNIEYTKLNYRKIVIPAFGDADHTNMQKVVAVLADERFLQVYDCLERFKNIENPSGLNTNWYAHYWRIMFACPWANVVAFTTAEPTITSVTVSPSSGQQNKDTSIQLTANVQGTGVFSKRVTWSVYANTDNSTKVSNSGVLYIGKNESGTLTVKAVSVEDSTKYGTAEYTVS